MAASDALQFLNDLDKKHWTAADKLRSNRDAAVYMHAVLGLIFLKYVSDAFEIRQHEVETQLRDAKHDYFLDPADDEYGPTKGSMALLLANGSMSSNTKGEGEIRETIVKADLVECIVALPGQLFANTQIPACIWFLTKTKQKRRHGAAAFRDRFGEVLFIAARKLGYMVDRVLWAVTDEDTEKIVSTFDAWKRQVREPTALAVGQTDQTRSNDAYRDIPGFCKSAGTEEIAAHGYVLTPGRYVGAEEVEDDGGPFAEKIRELATKCHARKTVGFPEATCQLQSEPQQAAAKFAVAA